MINAITILIQSIIEEIETSTYYSNKAKKTEIEYKIKS